MATLLGRSWVGTGRDGTGRDGSGRVGSLWHAANKLRRALGSDSSNTQQQQQQHNGGNYDCDKGIGIWQSGIGERA